MTQFLTISGAVAWSIVALIVILFICYVIEEIK